LSRDRDVEAPAPPERIGGEFGCVAFGDIRQERLAKPSRIAAADSEGFPKNPRLVPPPRMVGSRQ
jgi:hypothetical protein